MPMTEPPRAEGLKKFEEQLRRFRPSSPRVLALPNRRVPWEILAAAAALFVVVALAFVVRSYPGRHANEIARSPMTVEHHIVARAITLGQLNVAWRSGDADLNRVLDDASPRLLPRERRGTALFALGKE